MGLVITTPMQNTLIPNTAMSELSIDGVLTGYAITPVVGYVLHDKKRDWTGIDPETEEEILYLGYTTGTATCAASYDFVANPREFYAVLESEVPADQVFNVPNNTVTE